MIAYHYFGGAGYPVGGASEIAAGIAPVIERTGTNSGECRGVRDPGQDEAMPWVFAWRMAAS